MVLKDIEDAYILSRYFPRVYSQREVEEMMEKRKSPFNILNPAKSSFSVLFCERTGIQPFPT